MVGDELATDHPIDRRGDPADLIDLKKVGELMKDEESDPVVIMMEDAVQRGRRGEESDPRTAYRVSEPIRAISEIDEADIYTPFRSMTKEGHERSPRVLARLGHAPT